MQAGRISNDGWNGGFLSSLTLDYSGGLFQPSLSGRIYVSDDPVARSLAARCAPVGGQPPRGVLASSERFATHFRSLPMLDDKAFQDLISKVRAGDDDAAAELVRLYEPAIRREVRLRLRDPRLRRMFD